MGSCKWRRKKIINSWRRQETNDKKQEWIIHYLPSHRSKINILKKVTNTGLLTSQLLLVNVYPFPFSFGMECNNIFVSAQ